MSDTLFEFQKHGITFLSNRKRALLADEMGLGKSAQAICASNVLEARRNLIICPASVKYNWKKEIDKWMNGATHFVVEGRGKETIPERNFIIINYDLLFHKPIFLQLIARQWDVLICDEAHYLKNNAAKRTKCVYYPKGIADHAEYVWLLTGTPVLNRPIELFSHLKALVPDRLGKYRSRYDYAVHFCDAFNGKWGWDENGASNLEELAEMLSGFMLRREKKDVLKDLPDKMYQTVYLTGDTKTNELIEKEKKSYEETRNSILGETATIRRELGHRKINQVVEHVKNILEEKRKIVVFCYHRDFIADLGRHLSAYNPAIITGATDARARQAQVEKFINDRACKVFIGQIEAAGTGIDGLQNVCDTVVFAELSYVPGQIHQAIDRCHRIGQQAKVLVQFLVLQNSLDEDIAYAISRKEKIIQKIVKKSEVEETTTKKGECSMSMENELKRIADSLERIEAKMNGVSVAPKDQVVVDEGKPVVKRKSTKAVQDVQAPPPANDSGADFGDDLGELKVEAAEDVPATPAEFLKMCNEKISAIANVETKRSKIAALKAKFEAKFKVTSILNIPVEKLAEAKATFDKVMKG